jgi:DNA-binding NarL/FixJ family response regulator
MKMNNKISVLLVEDHIIVRKGLKALLDMDSSFEVVGEAENGKEAIDMNHELKPDIIIMDIAMPVLNGFEASRQILKKDPKAKILILSAHSDDGYIEKAMALGVAGFLIKQCSPHFLVQALIEIKNGNRYYSSSILDRLKDETKPAIDGKLQKTKMNLLTARENQVLQLIAEGQANKQIANELNISVKTVEKHRQNLMNKLQIHDTAGITRYAIAEGIIECSSQKTIV